ncbi:MAG: sugar phosphate isomerase/epimerase [Eubacteriales bacterium]|nr:sugar phosphate isomerase/epimerase [Eubacteriales bacterium]
MKKISIGSWAYTFGPYSNNPIALHTVITSIAQMGFDGISLGGFKPHAHPDLYQTEKEQQQLIDLLASNNLEVVEYSPDVNIFNAILETDKYIDLYKKFISFMKKCGFSIVRLDTGVAPILSEGVTYDAALERVVSNFCIATDIAKDNGISVVWEFEPGFLFNKPSEIVRICDMVNRDEFSVLFDTCHAYMTAVAGAHHIGKKEVLDGGVTQLIEMLSGKIGLVHLIDSDGTLHNNDTSTHRPFGEGFIDFDEVIPALLHQGRYFADWWVIDLCFWPDAWNVTRKCKDYVDALNLKY